MGDGGGQSFLDGGAFCNRLHQVLVGLEIMLGLCFLHVLTFCHENYATSCLFLGGHRGVTMFNQVGVCRTVSPLK